MASKTAIYVRVSSVQQKSDSQMLDLQKWADAYGKGPSHTEWHEDKFTGKTMNRPAWNEVIEKIRAGKIDTLVIWRIDRLGRTVEGLSKLFAELIERKIRLVSVMDGIDLSTSTGRLIANVLASVAAYETEIRGERIRAGLEAKRQNGEHWGGGTKNLPHKMRGKKREEMHKLLDSGFSQSQVAEMLGVSRTTIAGILKKERDGVKFVG